MKFKGGLLSSLFNNDVIYDGYLRIQRNDGKLFIQDQGGFLFCTNDIKEMISICQEYLETYSQDDIDELNKEVYDFHFGNKLKSRHQKELERKLTKGYIYFLRDNTSGAVKIGKAINLDNRIENMKLPAKPTLLHSIFVNDYDKAEKIFHDAFSKHRKRGEWFDLPGSTINDIEDECYPEGINELLGSQYEPE